MEKIGLPKRCMEFFGKKDGQSTLEFKQELDKLTLQDKQDLCRYFNEAGMPTEAPIAK